MYREILEFSIRKQFKIKYIVKKDDMFDSHMCSDWIYSISLHRLTVHESNQSRKRRRRREEN